MPQRRSWNFKEDDKTELLNRWLTGLHPAGLYFGFDFAPSANMNLDLNHNTTGFKDVDDDGAESPFQSLVITRQGVVIRQDAGLTINGISVGHATNPRIDLVILTHAIDEIAGGTTALYSVIQGTPAGSPTVPALTDPELQIPIGQLYIPANTVALNGVGVTWTRSSKPTFANGNPLDGITGAITTVISSNLTASRAVVSDGSGKIVSSGITTTELNQLAGIGGTSIATQLGLKFDKAGGTITGNTIIGGTLDMAGFQIFGTATPVNGNQLTRKDYVDGQVATKQNTITGAITTVLTSNLTTNRVVVSNGSGKVISSGITDGELNTLSGISSNVQGQLNAEASARASADAGKVQSDSSIYLGPAINLNTLTSPISTGFLYSTTFGPANGWGADDKYYEFRVSIGFGVITQIATGATVSLTKGRVSTDGGSSWSAWITI